MLKNICRLAILLALAVPVCGQGTPAQPGKSRGQTDCQQAIYGGQWVNQSFAPQRGVFTAEFDAVQSLDGIRTAIIISDGPTTGTSNGPIFILFEEQANRVQIRKAGHAVNPTTSRPLNYKAGQEVKYAANIKLHFRVVADVPRQIFSVYVTAPGGSEQALAVDYAFEKTKSALTKLDNIAVNVKSDSPQPPDARNSVCHLKVRAGR